MQEFLGRFVAQQAAVPREKYRFAVTLKAGGALIGLCGIGRTTPSGPTPADARHEAALGYEYAPAQWGKGYATEAARAVLAFGFATLGAHRTEAHCVPENTGSARVLEKLGLRLEGRLRDKECFKDRWWDRLVYAALAADVEVGGQRSEGSAS